MNTLVEAFNSPDTAKEILTYNGWDAIHEYRLAKKQMELIYESTLPF